MSYRSKTNFVGRKGQGSLSLRQLFSSRAQDATSLFVQTSVLHKILVFPYSKVLGVWGLSFKKPPQFGRAIGDGAPELAAAITQIGAQCIKSVCFDSAAAPNISFSFN